MATIPAWAKGNGTNTLKGPTGKKRHPVFKRPVLQCRFSALKPIPIVSAPGPYEEFFKVSKKTDSLIQLSGTSSVIPINLHLIKKQPVRKNHFKYENIQKIWRSSHPVLFAFTTFAWGTNGHRISGEIAYSYLNA
jgi:hypothetical protein